jgi:glycosyltransferase involved in cell wall biosynthesis/predicted Zn-dependent protease
MKQSPVPGTIVIYGPHYQRSGFGLLSRVWAMALHAAGASVRIVPVDCNDPNSAEGLDDCDLYLLRSLQYTPIVGPVTAIFSYQPTYVWPRIPLPEPHLRIMLTTFDSTAAAATPPGRLVYICNQMDQLWVASKSEENAWIRGGMNPARLKSFHWPHNWLDNSVLPKVNRAAKRSGHYRFLHISLLIPRRRLDVLIRAFFEEFRVADEAELVLKITYPPHPVPGKPQRDIRALIQGLRSETGSRASLILDETLGTRMDLVKLIDSCDGYVSTDTTNTAPVSEAIVRHLPVIITDGWGVDLPPQALVVPNKQERIYLTPEMADYMPHQRGGSFPALDVGLVRQAMRKLFSLSADERDAIVQPALTYMRERYSYAATAPAAIAAILEGWAAKNATTVLAASPSTSNPAIVELIKTSEQAGARTETNKPVKPYSIHWSGMQLFYGKLPKFNREMALHLIRQGHEVSLMPANGPFHVEELDLNASSDSLLLADRFHLPLKRPADFNISARWHPIFNEHPAARQIIASTWWSGAVPSEWVHPINEGVNEVWVPSNFVRKNFLAGGIDEARIRIVPMGVDPTVFNPNAAHFPLKTTKNFKFLFVGETTPRRGFDTLLTSYIKTFTRRDDVCLVIKDIDCEYYYARLAMKQAVAECQKNPQCPEIEYVSTMLSEAEMAGLYTACDCFVQPHRAASFNLAALEAMACDRPVITTDFGGVKEFANSDTAYLIPAKTIRTRPTNIGHWRVTGEQLHAEIDPKILAERLRHAIQHSAEASRLGARAGQLIRTNFTWEKSSGIIQERLQAVLAEDCNRTHAVNRPKTNPTAAIAPTENGATIVFYAPFYNRSGYGVAARCLATTWHAAGLKIRIVPVDNKEEGVDDCDMDLLRSLEKTPVSTPVIALFFHVASPLWLQVELPPQSTRILYTTFDGTAQGLKPPAEWVNVCNGMDQLWLQTEKEANVFVAAGVPRSKIQILRCTHPWIGNISLPEREPKTPGAKFRFLSIAMFQPRRRWDALIEAFLAEFKDASDVELYLKVNYPSWHPVPDQPAKDLRRLIDSLRKKTGSSASIILDEQLGTRAGICRIIDRCDAYVSTDTTITAPVGEAFVRNKIAVIPDGYGAALPYCESTLIIPVDPQLVCPMTEEMLHYQPHHRGREMPLLRVTDVRQTLRAAYAIPEEKRLDMGRLASLVMECTYSPAALNPAFIKAMNKALTDKSSSAVVINWEGSFLDFGSLSFVNRSLTKALKQRPAVNLSLVSDTVLADQLVRSEELSDFAKQISPRGSNLAKITVRHQWPPDWTRPRQGALVIMQPWEFGTLPADWVRQATDVDEFWAYTNYVRNVYISSGVDAAKVKVVPLGIDPSVFRSDVPARPIATNKKFKFLFVGGTISRKGPDVLLRAYLANFTAADDVCLVIKDFGGKSVYAGQTLEPQIRAIQADPNAPEICYLNEELPASELPALYTACDSFVHPYRGEGFGLPILEAMACALPVIITAGGSADDFATDEFAYRIPATRRSIGDSVSGMKLAGDGWMLEPDVAALGERMKWVVAHRDEARALGQRASAHVRNQWTWDRAAGVVQERLEAIAALRKGLTSAPGPVVSRKAVSKAPPEVAKLGDLTKAEELFRKKSPRSAWDSASEAIRLRPHHPEAFLLLAEVARMVGATASAHSCAKHALALAPAFKPAKKFLKGSFQGTAKPPEWLVLPPSIERREKRLKPTLSVCLIVKNEERFIRQCLASVKDFADQIVVVDTGSTDRTVAIAREFGAEIHDFKWCDDFSAARNAALHYVTGEWVLSFDADEELPVENRPTFLRLLEDESVISWRLPLFDVGRENEGCNYVPRLFRNAPGLHFVGRVHEQVFYSIEARRVEWGLENRLGDAALRHHGYTKELIKERGKVERNLRLLERAVEELPGDPLLQMNYGLELCRSERVAEGIQQYTNAFNAMSALPPAAVTPETREALLTQYCTYLRIAKRPADLLPVLTSSLARQVELTASQHFLLGLAQMELEQYAPAAQQMRLCLEKRSKRNFTPINADILTVIPQHSIAICLWQAKDTDGADRAFQAAIAESPTAVKLRIDYARFLQEQSKPVDALQLLNKFVSANPEAVSVWVAGGQIALSEPGLLEVAVDWTTVASGHHSKDVNVLAQRGEALLLSGNLDLALPLWTELSDGGNPRAAAARILCETALGVDVRKPSSQLTKLADREFVRWYWRLVDFAAETTILQLHANVGSLEPVLPEAANLLHSAIAKLSTAETV